MTSLSNSRAVSRRSRFLDSEGGSVGLEIAFVITFLAVLAIGAVDFGRYAKANLALASAARAGVQYGMQDQSAATETGQMVQAARQDAGDVNQVLSITSRQYCSCPGGGEVTCGSTCGDGKYPEMYVEVTATDQLDLLLDYPGISQPLQLSWTSEIRVR